MAKAELGIVAVLLSIVGLGIGTLVVGGPVAGLVFILALLTLLIAAVFVL